MIHTIKVKEVRKYDGAVPAIREVEVESEANGDLLSLAAALAQIRADVNADQDKWVEEVRKGDGKNRIIAAAEGLILEVAQGGPDDALTEMWQHAMKELDPATAAGLNERLEIASRAGAERQKASNPGRGLRWDRESGRGHGPRHSGA